jgi:RNA polymerase sigma-70 factor (ECF subfamily)
MDSSRAVASARKTVQLDCDTFAELYSNCYSRLWTIAVGITGDRNEADDLVQEAALVAMGKMGDFEPGTSFPAWMSQIVRLRALNYIRQRRTRGTRLTDPRRLDHTRDHERPADPHVDRQTAAAGKIPDDQTHFDDEVTRALATLSQIARACLLLRVLHQLPYAEIAELLGLPEGTAMSYVHRARQHLRRQLAPGLQARAGQHTADD